MSAANCESEAFDLRRQGDLVVIAKPAENVVDGIVTGIIVDLLAFPLFSVALILGIWMMVLSLTEEHAFHFAPRFDHFASPGIVRAAEAALLPLLGIMFAGGSVCLMGLFLRSQHSFFPYQCRFKKNAEGSWTVQRKLWFLSFPWKNLGHDWRIWCYPSWGRGNWAYVFFIRTKRSRFFLARSGAFADSKSQAEKEAQKDLATLKALFDTPGELKRWN